jgi:hypothetical protein
MESLMDTDNEVDDQADPTEQSQADTIFNLVIVSLLVSFVLCVLPHLGMLTGAGNPKAGRQRGQEGVKGLNANLISTSASDATYVISVRVTAPSLGERDAKWKNLPRQTTYWTVEETDGSAREYHVFFAQSPRSRPRFDLMNFRAAQPCQCEITVFVGGRSLSKQVILPGGRSGSEDLAVFTINFSAVNDDLIQASEGIVIQNDPAQPNPKT